MFSRSLIVVLISMAVVWHLPVGERIEIDRTTMPADGSSIARARAYRTNVFGFAAFGEAPRLDVAPAVTVELGVAPTAAAPTAAVLERGVTPAELVSVLPSHDGSLVLRALHRPGVLAMTAGAARAELVLEPAVGDADEDGLPDAAELLAEEDRAAFTAWFTAIAEAQVVAIDDAWPAVHHDCAGLIRFAYREALKAHDASWLAKRKGRISISHPDVAAIRYPELPFMGDLPFRKKAGRFDPRVPAEEQFTAAASATVMWHHNTKLISDRLEDARPGDLLFFRVPQGSGSRMHSMILLGDRPGATPTDRVTRAIYHSGEEVRLVALTDLLAHPDLAWHPVADNPRFLGVHRFELLVHEPKTPLAASLREVAR